MKKKTIPFELLFWVLSLLLLALNNTQTNHFTLCPLANLGFSWCPGCGMGRAITAVFHGNVHTALRLHWFVLPALGILLYRIAVLSKQFILSLKN